MLNTYKKYEVLIKSLTVKISLGIKAPHKAIMLLSIFDSIISGKIKGNHIPLDDSIAYEFKKYWQLFISNKDEFAHYSCAPWTPFWHLKQESFWHFKDTMESVGIENIVAKGQTASIGKMRKNISFAYIDSELYKLLLEPIYNRMLCNVLIDTYINIQ